MDQQFGFIVFLPSFRSILEHTHQKLQESPQAVARYPQNSCVRVCVLSCFSCVQLCDPMDCSSPVSFVHDILQARIVEWVAVSSSETELMSPALQADSLLLSLQEAPKIAEKHKIVYVGIMSYLLFLDSAELFFLGFP